MAACCYIVPPHLLRAIAESEHNPEHIRQAASQALSHHERIVVQRENRLSILSQPRGYRGAIAQQLNARQSIVPDVLLQQIADNEEVDEETRAYARRDLEHIREVQDRYQAAQQAAAQADSQPDDQQVFGIESSGGKEKPHRSDKVYRAVYDAKHSEDEDDLPGTIVRAEGQKAVKDTAIDEAYDEFGNVLKFYKEKFDWNSIDNQGMNVIGSCHFGQNYENACKSPRSPLTG